MGALERYEKRGAREAGNEGRDGDYSGTSSEPEKLEMKAGTEITLELLPFSGALYTIRR